MRQPLFLPTRASGLLLNSIFFLYFLNFAVVVFFSVYFFPLFSIVRGSPAMWNYCCCSFRNKSCIRVSECLCVGSLDVFVFRCDSPLSLAFSNFKYIFRFVIIIIWLLFWWLSYGAGSPPF